MSSRRVDLQKLARLRLEDSLFLLSGNRWGAAYYLAGYAIELAIKACIARQFRADEIPDLNYVKKIYSHEINVLINVAGLGRDLLAEQDRSDRFQANWGILGAWSSESRYQIITPMDSQLLLGAISEPEHGVFPWIAKHW